MASATPASRPVAVRARAAGPEAATARPGRRVRRPARPAAVAHRGAPARRPDRAARGARRRLPRRARDARGGPPRQRQLVRRGRQPADPDQEPGDAAAAGRSRGRRRPADEAPDPEAELRARLLLYRAHRDAGLRLADGALAPDRALPARAVGARTRPRLAGARPRRCAAARPARGSSAALDRLVALAPAARAAARGRGRGRSPSPSARTIIRAALRDAPTVVLQDLLGGVRDRVVIAVTFLAMLELMKRREIVVEQARAVGPDRGPRDDRRGAGRGGRAGGRRRRAARRVAGVVRVTDDEAREIDDRDRAASSGSRPPAPRRSRPDADRADRGGPRGAPVRRRAAADAARDRGARRRRPRRPSTRGSATSRSRCATAASACSSTATGSSWRPRPRAAPWSRATSAPTRSASRRRRSRRSRSWPTASRSRSPRSSGSAASTPTTRSARCSTAGSSSSSAAPTRPAGRSCTAPGFDFLERFGLTSLDELPPLDADVAARLAEEGGEPPPRPPEADSLTLDDAIAADRRRRLMPAERLQKVLAAAGVASRRASEVLIADGPRHGRRQGRQARRRRSTRSARSSRSTAASSAGPSAPAYLLLHKPAGVDLDRRATGTRDRPSSTCSRRRSSPRARGSTRSAGSTRIPRACSCSPTTATGPSASCIRASASSASTRSGCARRSTATQVDRAQGRHRARRGARDADRPAGDDRHRGRRAWSSSSGPPRPSCIWYRATLAQGWKRQLRRMFGAVGAPIERLVRVRIGPVRLDGLQSGAVRPLKAPEIRGLGRRRRQQPARSDPGSTKPKAQTPPRPPRPPKPRPPPGRAERLSCPDGRTDRRPRRARLVGQEQRRGGRGARARLPLLRHRPALSRGHLARRGPRRRGRRPGRR